MGGGCVSLAQAMSAASQRVNECTKCTNGRLPSPGSVSRCLDGQTAGIAHLFLHITNFQLRQTQCKAVRSAQGASRSEFDQ